MAKGDIKPTRGTLLVRVLEDDEPPAAKSQQYPGTSGPTEGVLAQVVAAGAETEAKAGDSVIVSADALTNARKFSGMVFVDQWSVWGRIASS